MHPPCPDRATTGQAAVFTCPACDRITRHPGDVAARYCGWCRWYTGDPWLGPANPRLWISQGRIPPAYPGDSHSWPRNDLPTRRGRSGFRAEHVWVDEPVHPGSTELAGGTATAELVGPGNAYGPDQQFPWRPEGLRGPCPRLRDTSPEQREPGL